MRVLAGMGHGLDRQAELRPRLWRSDLLKSADWYAMALADAAEADILFVAIHTREVLEPGIHRWFRSCLAQFRCHGGVVVALLGPPGEADAPGSTRLEFMRLLARDAGVDFFAPRSPEGADGINLTSRAGEIGNRTSLGGAALPPRATFNTPSEP